MEIASACDFVTEQPKFGTDLRMSVPPREAPKTANGDKLELRAAAKNDLLQERSLRCVKKQSFPATPTGVSWIAFAPEAASNECFSRR